ncbi:MAG: hypothetical protein QN163_10075, partial [Armatimonadota bacterium]|nr:hypothetical protein [Armatimonadota bacterium]
SRRRRDTAPTAAGGKQQSESNSKGTVLNARSRYYRPFGAGEDAMVAVKVPLEPSSLHCQSTPI